MCNAQARVAIDLRAESEVKKAALNRMILSEFEDIVTYFLKDEVINHDYIVESNNLKVLVEINNYNSLIEAFIQKRPKLVVEYVQRLDNSKYLLTLGRVLE